MIKVNTVKVCGVVLAALLLAGCQTTQPTVIVTKNVVIEVPEVLYNCPVVTKLPEAKTLTNVQVARLIVQLQRNNVTCHTNINAIRRYIAEAKRTVV